MSIIRNYDIYSIEERVHNLEMGGSPTPGGDSWDYSTEETDTHQKWIDGKTIYCRVISGTFNFRQNVELTILANKGDVDKIIECHVLEATCGCGFPIIYTNGSAIVGRLNSDFNTNNIILFYTKTEPTKSTKRSKK